MKKALPAGQKLSYVHSSKQRERAFVRSVTKEYVFCGKSMKKAWPAGQELSYVHSSKQRERFRSFGDKGICFVRQKQLVVNTFSHGVGIPSVVRRQPCHTPTPMFDVTVIRTGRRFVLV